MSEERLDHRADEGETAASRKARDRAFGQSPLSEERLAEAIAAAQERVRNMPVKEKPLPEIIRCSVRCGFESFTRERPDGTRQVVTKPKAIDFKANETADGKPVSIEHGKPVRLKREAYVKYAALDQVLIAQ